MKLLLITLHLITSLSLIRMLWWMKLKYKLPINFYNLPIILMFALGNIAFIYLSFTKFLLYIPIGIFLAVFFWNQISLIDLEEDLGIYYKIFFCIMCGLIWPEIFTFIVFYHLNSKKIE